MKNLKRIVLLSFVLSSIITPMKSQAPSSWFTSKEVSPNIWQIDDHGSDNIYLVIGKTSALLIDNGIGAANLRDYVKSITSLPVTVVITHGHPDHAGSNYQFSEVYIHPADMPMVLMYNSIPKIKGNGMAQNIKLDKQDLFTDTLNHKPTVMKSVNDGQIFDLGGRKLEVVYAPGHTPGEICLLDKENKILITGDNSNTLVWLHIRGCTPLDEYLKTLQKINDRRDDFNTILPGHGAPIDGGFIGEQIECVRSILAGTCESKPYETFAGNGMTCTYKRAVVAYNPENLKKK